MEVFSRATEQSKVFFISLFKLPPVKALYFTLELGLGIRRIFRYSHNNNGIMPIPPVYTLRDENSFMLNFQSRHTKAVKADIS